MTQKFLKNDVLFDFCNDSTLNNKNETGNFCEDLGIRHSDGFIFAWPLGFCQSLEGKLLDQ